MLGATITVTIASNIKLNPINPKNKAAAILSGLIPANRGLKNMIVNKANIPVFKIGTTIDAKIEDNKS